MPKQTKQLAKKPSIAWACGFTPPNAEQQRSAIGTFPWGNDNQRMNRKEALIDRPAADEDLQFEPNFTNATYDSKVNNNSMGNWKDLPEPTDESSWLATYAEEGQTFDQYVQLLTHRSGKFKPIVEIEKRTIYLQPICRIESPNEENTGSLVWPSSGPHLVLIRDWVASFFGLPTVVLDPVGVYVFSEQQSSNSRKRKQTDIHSSKEKATIAFRTKTYESYLKGRVSSHDSSKFQIHIDLLLSELVSVREELLNRGPADQSAASLPATVIGVTMEDLYSHGKDLFIAGMAAGRSKVAVLSFFRYHPNLRMHFQVWDDYYYHSKGCDYPYVTKLAQPMRLPYEVPEFSSLEKHYQAEYIRRAGKAIVHEICHVFGIDHCIHYNCLMNGTGHLVEDYAAPTFLCGICLRKLQFSIGFSVSMRYEMLKNIFATAGMKTEVKWIEKRLQYLRANDPKPVIINLV